MRERSIATVAADLGVSGSTLRRWVGAGLIATDDHGCPTDLGVAQGRVVARLRARGYSLRAIIEAHERGTLASSALVALEEEGRRRSVRQAARDAGLSPRFARKALVQVGMLAQADEIGPVEQELLGHVAALLEAGLPESVVLQLARVYAQSMRQIADAEVRLMHHQVHEPMMDAGMGPGAIAEAMGRMVDVALPLSTPILESIHRRYLREFSDQDLVGHMEDMLGADRQGPDGADDLTRVRVAIAFADLAGFTQMTDELGDARAIDTLERFMDAVVESLPDDARFVKTIGDEAMIVSPDVVGLLRWAVTFQDGANDRKLPARIGVHCGEALFYQGDYYGRAVNLASRLVARASEDEVVVTDDVADLKPSGVEFERLGEIRLRGFSKPTGILLASAGPR
ncbi:MAG: adenylate/guanylate cyclase domain-containing protein [Baekduia sp.]